MHVNDIKEIKCLGERQVLGDRGRRARHRPRRVLPGRLGPAARAGQRLHGGRGSEQVLPEDHPRRSGMQLCTQLEKPIQFYRVRLTLIKLTLRKCI